MNFRNQPEADGSSAAIWVGQHGVAADPSSAHSGHPVLPDEYDLTNEKGSSFRFLGHASMDGVVSQSMALLDGGNPDLSEDTVHSCKQRTEPRRGLGIERSRRRRAKPGGERVVEIFSPVVFCQCLANAALK